MKEKISNFIKTKQGIILILVIVFAVVIMVSVFLSDNSYDPAKDPNFKPPEVETPVDAISVAKNASDLNLSICRALGFKQYRDPEFGVCDASENSDGTWTVTLRGSMSGYLDEYQSDYERKQFEAEVTVTKDRIATIEDIKRVY